MAATDARRMMDGRWTDPGQMPDGRKTNGRPMDNKLMPDRRRTNARQKLNRLPNTQNFVLNGRFGAGWVGEGQNNYYLQLRAIDINY
jgi:hypothetical protein